MEKQITISSLLYRISVLQQTILTKKLKQIGVSQDQARTLNLIESVPLIKQTEIARYVGRSDASTSNLLKGLEKNHLIERKVSEFSDREKQLQLTEDGVKMVQKIQVAFDELNQLVDQSVVKQDELSEQLTKIVDGLKGE
ncbi:MarR family winged helix-turn-helix transcriptional regulator [Lentilactobacillus sp. SPB1-3]|uniref:MarR family winged helix-turn-helix transcriptional regulator n=1 Tax=Lentilactobacillus terminaliae TaxID=3003483 RepID=A0ACD5DEY0_9LACO|nr:MarR family transcriptional regulator [Lentilactobacillus sp. SPB1-3]MCZ0976491.1 winged helix DNA-binding protein [Lentilactobacillus sp. SPB1-3]